MELVIDQADSVTIAELRGRIDSASARPFQQQLEALIHAGAAGILIDLRQVTYVGSTGLRAFLVAARLIRQHQGNLVLCSIPPEIMRIFELSGLGGLLPICASRDEGIVLAAQPAHSS